MKFDLKSGYHHLDIFEAHQTYLGFTWELQGKTRRIVTLMFEKRDLLMKFDLKSGYHHLDIFEAHQTYLGFTWELQGKTRYYVFTVLPLVCPRHAMPLH